jgi:hypothetical protein
VARARTVAGYAIPGIVVFFFWLVVVILAIILLAFIVHWAGGGVLKSAARTLRPERRLHLIGSNSSSTPMCRVLERYRHKETVRNGCLGGTSV